jgi:predicted nuclease of predicted toxin-antitoxin system
VRFLIDEMFPSRTCELLAERGHDAAHVRDRGVNARPDNEVAPVAIRESRALVTENVKDFAAQQDLAVVCVLKSCLPTSGMAEHLARLLDRWATANPDPYLGLHWPLE